MITGNLLSHLDGVKTATVLPVDPLLPQDESLVGPDEEDGDPPAAPPGPKRGPGRGRRAKGRRPGAAAAAASRNKGEEEITVRPNDSNNTPSTSLSLCVHNSEQAAAGSGTFCTLSDGILGKCFIYLTEVFGDGAYLM